MLARHDLTCVGARHTRRRCANTYLTLDSKGGADRLLCRLRQTSPGNTTARRGDRGWRDENAEVKGVDVAANGKTELKPGGFIMLVGLTDGLKSTRFPLKLKFEGR